MSTAIFYDLENISKFTTPRNYDEFKKSVAKICGSELADEVVLQRAYISTNHPGYIKYHRFLKSTGIDICGVDPTTNSNKANLVDFKMNVDCIAYSLSHDLDTVVIATGDADFGFLVEELKAYGKRVVVASYGITTNKSIIMICDDWVDFSGEYALCDINELMQARIRLEEPVDYKHALRGVIRAMLDDKLLKRYMSLERFDLEMLRAFTERFYRAPYLQDVSYRDFIDMLIGGLEIELTDRNGRIVITPAETPLPEPPLNIYEVISGMDFDFSADRFRAWHSWFEENIDSVGELMYYMNFMLNNGLMKVSGDESEIVPQRKCAAALMEHTSAAVSLLNIKPEDRELEKLKKRFYRNPPKRRAEAVKQEDVQEEAKTYIQGVTTNFGRIVVYADDEAVFRVAFTEDFVKYDANDITMTATSQLREYFKGDRKEFTFPVRMNGSDFQKKVWSELANIPYGETRSYKQIAEAIGSPKSGRAVGNACNKNELLFVVPCHRAIGASGKLVGYAAGLELKEALIRSESSPVDFKRFGKQYAYNARHPESKGEYRTSAEISALLEEERLKKEAQRASDTAAAEAAQIGQIADEQAAEEPAVKQSVSAGAQTGQEPVQAEKPVGQAPIQSEEPMTVTADAQESEVLEKDEPAPDNEADAKPETADREAYGPAEAPVSETEKQSGQDEEKPERSADNAAKPTARRRGGRRKKTAEKAAVSEVKKDEQPAEEAALSANEDLFAAAAATATEGAKEVKEPEPETVVNKAEDTQEQPTGDAENKGGDNKTAAAQAQPEGNEQPEQDSTGSAEAKDKPKRRTVRRRTRASSASRKYSAKKHSTSDGEEKTSDE